MIAPQGEKLRFRIGRVDESWDARTEFEEGRCHLVEGKSIVKRRDRDIATVKDTILSLWVNIHSFGGSTGALRYGLGAPDLLEQRKDGWGSLTYKVKCKDSGHGED